MSGYGPSPLARDAYHADRLYWQRNPPKRPKNGLTLREAAKVLGILPASLLHAARAGWYAPIKREKGAPWYFDADYIANRALEKQLKKAAKRGGG